MTKARQEHKSVSVYRACMCAVRAKESFRWWGIGSGIRGKGPSLRPPFDSPAARKVSLEVGDHRHDRDTGGEEAVLMMMAGTCKDVKRMWKRGEARMDR